MPQDPGQRRDVAAANPELTARLATAVADWKAEILPDHDKQDRPFLLGDAVFRYTQIPARDGVTRGNVERSNRFPNCSFFTNWTSLDDRIAWDVEVRQAGTYRVELERFYEFSPCQDGGIAAFLFEHGNAGCGDSNWPKSLLYVAGWGYGTASLNGETLYEDYEIHFMVTQGMRDRKTLAVKLSPDSNEAGSVNPAAQQLDFYIRSPQRNDANHPGREVFDHFFAMEVTWQ